MELAILLLTILYMPMVTYCNPLLSTFIPFDEYDLETLANSNGRVMLARELFAFNNSFFQPLKGEWTVNKESDIATTGVFVFVIYSLLMSFHLRKNLEHLKPLYYL
jgi:hypothetical protein